MTFGRYELKVLSRLRYLGAYIPSTLNRRKTVADRILKSMNVYRTLVGFVKENCLRWGTSRQLYYTITAPIVYHGLKVITLTKRNRDKLRDMESNIVSGLHFTSRRSLDDLPSLPISMEGTEDFDGSIALDNHTINRRLRMARLLNWAHLERMDEGEIFIQLPDPAHNFVHQTLY